MDGMNGYLSRRTRFTLANFYSMLLRHLIGIARLPGTQNPLPNDIARALREDIRDFEMTMGETLKVVKRMLDDQSTKLDAQANKLDDQSTKLDAQAKKLDAQAAQLQPEDFRQRAIELLSVASSKVVNIDRELQEAGIIKKVDEELETGGVAERLLQTLRGRSYGKKAGGKQ
ncbi:hypothetical protein MMC30_008619 [Trapelia coarctata]|nr:hypothetical protein [Trapelia coarctata]